jgi:hypothetical protein
LPDITLPYPTLTDGTTIESDKLNQDFYEVPNALPVNKLSLWETSNGQITFPNLDSKFKVRSHMVRPWKMGHAISAGMTDPIDFFEDAWSSDAVYYGIAGANLTWYQPMDVTVAQLFASGFFSIWRQHGVKTQDVYAAAPDIFTRCAIDGVSIPHTVRPFPQTIYFEEGGNSYGGQQDYSFAGEERMTRYFNLHHPMMPSGNSGDRTGQLTKGFHTFGMRIYMAQNQGSENVNLDGSGPPENYPPSTLSNVHRVRAYVRHVDVLRLF